MFINEWLADANVCEDAGTEWVLKYYLRIDENQCYGFRVEKYSITGERLETEVTPPLTDSRDKAQAMAQALINGTVTPFVLMEIVEELYF